LKVGAARETARGCALVTGSSRGIGASIARGLAADGWAVGVNYRSGEEPADAVVDEIRDRGGEALAIGADVSDPSAPEEMFGRLEREFERPVLVLVNNAATLADSLVFKMDDEEWRVVLETNLSAVFRLSRRALRPMLRSRFGRIVNIASIVGAHQAKVGQANYAASKAGLIGLTKTLAVEVAARSVTVNAIAPGVIDTEGSHGKAEEMRAAVPAGRAGTADEVAACARFLVSRGADYVTGSVLTVDGGLTA
jgi:3-oxoacyl-[acyl-carrier protein] reductase